VITADRAPVLVPHRLRMLGRDLRDIHAGVGILVDAIGGSALVAVVSGHSAFSAGSESVSLLESGGDVAVEARRGRRLSGS
jgi:hypothetical protein